MGLFTSIHLEEIPIDQRPDRVVFVRNIRNRYQTVNLKTCKVYGLDISFKRYHFTIWKTYGDILKLDKLLRKTNHVSMINCRYNLPIISFCSCTQIVEKSLSNRIVGFIQHIVDDIDLFYSDEVKSFLGIGLYSFKPELGSMGKDGFLYKGSGGYHKKFSNRPGDYIKVWNKRYFVFRDNHFAWYDPKDWTKIKGLIQIDEKFCVTANGRWFTIHCKTRTLNLRALSVRQSMEWDYFFKSYYYTHQVPRMLSQPNAATFPERDNIDVKIYTLSKDYMAAVSIAILSAQKEIFITSWKNSPSVLLCRPPLPPIRLDQLLKYKADLGIKIYILLYKEVELAGQGNNSQKAMDQLKKLSPNIQCIRHPNKFLGGSTALLWSHHEKLVIIDRTIAFVGGIDLAFNRWDDDLHHVMDEDGVKYPGSDYRQPGMGKFQLAIDPNPLKSKVIQENEQKSDDIHQSPELVKPLVPPFREPARPSLTSITETMNVIAEQAKAQITDHMNTLAESAKKQFDKYVLNPYIEKVTREAMIHTYDIRFLFPRTAWHDIHSSISGQAARDIASHFIQRWNHHRLSSGTLNTELLREMTDDTHYGKCARCETSFIFEEDIICQTCGYDLGPISGYLEEPKDDLLPPPLSSFSFVSFECTYFGMTGCIFQGDGPIVVSQTSDTTPYSSYILETVNNEEVHNVNTMNALNVDDDHNHNPFSIREEPNNAWFPKVGDIVIKLNEFGVTHLNHKQFSRLASRIRLRHPREPITITFRRHTMPEQENIEAATLTIGLDLVQFIPSYEPSAPLLDDENGGGSGDDNIYRVEDISVNVIRHDSSTITNKNETLVEANLVVESEVDNAILKVDDASLVEDDNHASRVYSPPNTTVVKYALTKETLYAMSCLYHEVRSSIPVASKHSGRGTCKVQVLRSVGPWSIGIDPEYSILNAWKDAIKNAKKFIYIENQFFIGSLAGNGVKNSIPSAILDRILQAVREGEDFKVIVILPQHPSGDIAQSTKPRIILNYEYLTISRGRNALIEQLKAKLSPGVSYTKYINFYCLRNYGVINDKIYSDQIYVHDKVLIVDDQIAIIGSANINDRSMLGDRDSEVAIKIQDNESVTISMGRMPYEASKTVFNFRMRLMNHHVGKSSSAGELVDILRSEVFDDEWHGVADSNTYAYDSLDGKASVYKCETLSQYRSALAEYKNPSVDDGAAIALAGTIQGFLVHWPLNFLSKEDMSPPIALRAVLSNQLWV